MGSALPQLGLPSRADVFAAALEGLVQVDQLLVERDPNLPPLYGSGARYIAHPHRTWRRADQIAREGWGDCEGLSAWRVAELRASGEDPSARVGVYHTGPGKYHAVVIRSDDTIEDPSVALGLHWRPEMPTTRDELNEVNGWWVQEHAPATIDVIGADEASASGEFTTEIVKHPKGGVAAQVKVPLADGSGSLVATSSPSANEAEASGKAANMILALSKKIATDPLLAATLSPTAAVALALYQQPEIRKLIEKGAKTAIDAGKKVAQAVGPQVITATANAYDAIKTLGSALKFW